MNKTKKQQEKEDLLIKINELKYEGVKKLRNKDVAKILGISLTKLAYVTASPEKMLKIKIYQKKIREMRKKIALNTLKQKIETFKKRTKATKDYNYLDVIKYFGPNPTCYLTGLPIDYEDSKTYQLDHFIPVTKQGSGDLDNMRLAHPMANEMKRNYDFEKFLEICRLIAEKHPRN